MKLKSIITLFLFLNILSACGPTYSSTYRYLPLQTSTQRGCANNCSVAKQACEIQTKNLHENCLNRSEFAYQQCESRKIFTRQQDGSVECVQNCYCPRETCNLNLETCDSNHRTCYLDCGGEIEKLTSCVSNCKEAAPATTTLLSNRPARTHSVSSVSYSDPSPQRARSASTSKAPAAKRKSRSVQSTGSSVDNEINAITNEINKKLSY